MAKLGFLPALFRHSGAYGADHMVNSRTVVKIPKSFDG
jgi:hypothetical protein